MSLSDIITDLREILTTHGRAELDMREFLKAQEKSAVVRAWTPQDAAAHVAAELGCSYVVTDDGDSLVFTRR